MLTLAIKLGLGHRETNVWRQVVFLTCVSLKFSHSLSFTSFTLVALLCQPVLHYSCISDFAHLLSSCFVHCQPTTLINFSSVYFSGGLICMRYIVTLIFFASQNECQNIALLCSEIHLFFTLAWSLTRRKCRVLLYRELR